MKTKILALLFAIISTPAFARWCNNPYCAMCNRLFGPMPQYQTYFQPVQKQVEIKPAAEALPFVATPEEAIAKALWIASPRPGEIIYDLGCGDARVLIHAASKYRIAGVGVEVDGTTAQMARDRVLESGFAKSIRIVERDAKRCVLNRADLIYMYLFPDVIEELHYTLGDARMVISYYHDIPQLPTRKIRFLGEAGREHVFYIYKGR